MCRKYLVVVRLRRKQGALFIEVIITLFPTDLLQWNVIIVCRSLWTPKRTHQHCDWTFNLHHLIFNSLFSRAKSQLPHSHMSLIIIVHSNQWNPSYATDSSLLTSTMLSYSLILLSTRHHKPGQPRIFHCINSRPFTTSPLILILDNWVFRLWELLQ